MQALFSSRLISPGSLVTVVGALLTVVGSVAYLNDNANLSLPTIFYGIPILLGGLALKSSELPPPLRLTPPQALRELRQQPENLVLSRLLADVSRWRYGQKAHLESSLEVLKLWDEDAPPQLLSIEELDCDGAYGLRLRFACEGVPLERWRERQERLGRFFGTGLRAELRSGPANSLLLSLVPQGWADPPQAPASPDDSGAA
ncbi:MAG: DUF2854 domain-containing protein [Cyanobium sp.]